MIVVGLSHGYIVAVCDYQMVRQLNVHCRKGVSQPLGGKLVIGGRTSHTAGVVVRQYNGGGIGTQSHFHNAANRDSGGVDTAFSHFLTAEHFAFGGARGQREKLETEGVIFQENGRVDLLKYGMI